MFVFHMLSRSTPYQLTNSSGFVCRASIGNHVCVNGVDSSDREHDGSRLSGWSTYVVVICFSDVCFQLFVLPRSVSTQFCICCCSYMDVIMLHGIELSHACLSGSVRFPMCSARPSLILLLLFYLNRTNLTHSWMCGRIIAHGVPTTTQIFLRMFV